jgi:hypothetical protein
VGAPGDRRRAMIGPVRATIKNWAETRLQMEAERQWLVSVRDGNEERGEERSRGITAGEGGASRVYLKSQLGPGR